MLKMKTSILSLELSVLHFTKQLTDKTKRPKSNTEKELQDASQNTHISFKLWPISWLIEEYFRGY